MKTTANTLLSLLIILLIFGCGGPTANIKGKIMQGTILVLPPKNAEQFGEAHEHAKASGAVLQFYLFSELKDRGWYVITTDIKSFTHHDIPTEKEMIDEGKRLSADYALYVQLGEFLDAAPFTFRQDYVNLDMAKLIDIRSGTVVWAIDKGYSYGLNMELDSGNPGSVWRFLPRMAEDIVKKIDKASDKTSRSKTPAFDEKQLAAAGYRLLNGDEIRSMFAGNTVYAKFGKANNIIYFSPDGKARTYYRSKSGEYKKATGQWKVTKDNLCDDWGRGIGDCDRVYIRSKEIVFVNIDGKFSAEGMIVQGNPKDL